MFDHRKQRRCGHRTRPVLGMLAIFGLVVAPPLLAWDADLDTLFSYPDGLTYWSWYAGVTNIGYSVAIQPDGKIIVAGTSYNGSDLDFAVARLLPEGALDYSFGTAGRAYFDYSWGDDVAYDVAIQPDGRIVVVGDSYVDGDYGFGIVRFNANGTVHQYTTIYFPTEAHARAVALQTDGKIVVGGRAFFTSPGWNFAVARLNQNLTLDTTFSGDGRADWDFGDEGYDAIYDVAINGDGEIVTAGTATYSGQKVFGIMWWNGTTGAPAHLGMASFSSESWGFGLALQPDGKAVVVGNTSSGADFAIARFNDNGLKDTTFSTDGMAIYDYSLNVEGGRAVIVQRDGKLVVTGHLQRSGVLYFAMLRYLPNGLPDPSFNDGSAHAYVNFLSGYDASAFGAAMQHDGKIVAVGQSEGPFGQLAAIERCLGDEDLIFYDDFESGNGAFWSSSTP